VKLADLQPQPQLLLHGEGSYAFADDLAKAQGVSFLCPKCFATNGGPAGTHIVLCWFQGRGVPDTAQPKPGRWPVNGTSLDDITLMGSVLLQGACGWHGFVTAGLVTSC